MSGETIITVCGNATGGAELRYTAAGAAVAKFTVASTPRTYNKQTQAWEDGATLFLPVSVWRQQAEHVAESVEKGCRVIVQGRLSQRSYEDREGVKRTVFEIEADDVAVSLRSATAKVTKVSSGQGAVDAARRQQGAASVQDPWTEAPGTQRPASGGWGDQGGDEPPF
ncbi:single-stranded DNA-binding protein [Streptomyces sp. NPDC056437]|uniref:single-stranded DNA-binding protein n=1 Tax=Streptomyces sp. NPDC056437 TaxID=3345816 RepID=UPI00369D46B3